jgi:transcriptional regulator with GAF, ATPase, and Fis domain
MYASRSCPCLDRWPGNVRELEHHRAVSFASGSIIPRDGIALEATVGDSLQSVVATPSFLTRETG